MSQLAFSQSRLVKHIIIIIIICGQKEKEKLIFQRTGYPSSLTIKAIFKTVSSQPKEVHREVVRKNRGTQQIPSR